MIIISIVTTTHRRLFGVVPVPSPKLNRKPPPHPELKMFCLPPSQKKTIADHGGGADLCWTSS